MEGTKVILHTTKYIHKDHNSLLTIGERNSTCLLASNVSGSQILTTDNLFLKRFQTQKYELLKIY